MKERMQINNNITKELKSSVSNILYNFVKAKEILDTYTDDDGTFYKLKTPLETPYKKNCPFHVPQAYVDNYNEKRKTKTQNIDPERLYTNFAIQAHNGKITDNCLKQVVRLWKQRQGVIITKKDGAIIAFESNAKGSKRYANQLRNKIAEHAKRANILKKSTYFLTLTERVKPGETDCKRQYKKFVKETENFLNYLCRTFNCYYEKVIESTKNGYAHAHIVIHIDEYFKDDIKRKHGRSYEIVGGSFREWIKNHWSLGVSKLETSQARNPIFYLLKYITKFSYSNFSEITKEKHKLTDNERKGILTIFLSILAQVRQITTSQFDESEIDRADKLLSLKEESEKTMNVSENKIADKVGGLDCACINSTLPCQKFARLLNYQRFKEKINDEVENFDKQEQKIKEKLYEMAVPLGCQGCIITHILNEIKTHKDEWFHKKEIESDDVIFDESDREIDKSYTEFQQKYSKNEFYLRRSLLEYIDEKALATFVSGDDINATFYNREPLIRQRDMNKNVIFR